MTTSSALRTRRAACESTSTTPCCRAWLAHRLGRCRPGTRELNVEGDHCRAARSQVLRQDAADLAVADQRESACGLLNRCTCRPAFSSGSRILYMSRPSTPDASLARFSPSLASRAAAASSVLRGHRARHADHAVVVGDDHVARVHQRAGADHRDVDRAERGLDRALGADGRLHTGKPISVSVFTSRTPASMTSAARAAGLESWWPAGRRRSRRCFRPCSAATTMSPGWICSAATCSIQLSPGCSSTVTAVPETCAPG